MLYCTSQILLFFLTIQHDICGKPALSKSIDNILPTAFAYFMSLHHILIILTIFQTSLLLFNLLWVICDQPSLMLLLWLNEGSGGYWHILAVFLIAHIDYIIMHWEAKKNQVTHLIVIFTLLWWSGTKPKLFLRYDCI